MDPAAPTPDRTFRGLARPDDGFTLVEVLIAIALVGVLSAVAVVGVGRLTSSGTTAACAASLDAARAGVPVHLTTTASYPASLGDMVASGSLSLPSSVTLDGTGTTASTSKWTLTLVPGTPPTFSCSSQGSAGGPAALPVPNSALWFDAAQTSSVTTASQCTSGTGWRDKSGNNLTLLPRAATTTVTRSANALNGRPAIVTTGADLLLNNGVLFGGSASVFVVARNSGAPAGRILSSPNTNWLLGWWNGYQDDAYYNGWVSTAHAPVTTNALLYSTTITSGSLATVWRNGTQIASNNSGTGLPSGLTVGGWSTTEFSRAAVSEVIAYDRALTDTERQQTERYLADKWGLTVSGTAASVMAPTPLAWYDATDPADFGSISTCTAAVTRWADLSGRGYDLVPRASSPTAATHATSGLLGRPAVVTSGLNALVNDSASFGPNATVFVVARSRSTSAGRILSSSVNNWLLGWWGGRQDTAYSMGWVNLPNTPVTTNALMYSSTIASGVATTVWRNGTPIASNASGTAPPVGISIGGWPTSEFTSAAVGEVIVYDRLLTDAERQLVEAYLSSKWGVALG